MKKTLYRLVNIERKPKTIYMSQYDLKRYINDNIEVLVWKANNPTKYLFMEREWIEKLIKYSIFNKYQKLKEEFYF